MPPTSTLDFASRPTAKFRNQGLLAVRPNPEGIGDTYLATDTGQVFTSIDGVNWTAFGGSSALNDLSDVVAATWTKGALLVGHDAVQWSVWGPGQSGYAPIFDSSQSGGLNEYPFKLQNLLDVETGSPADGEVPTWSTANQQFEYATPSGGGTTYKGAKVSRITSDQALATGTEPSLEWNNDVYDASGLHDPVTNSERITFDADGEKYRVIANVVLVNSGGVSTGAVARVKIKWHDDSGAATTVIAEQVIGDTLPNSNNCGVSLSGEVEVDTDDYVFVTVENQYDDEISLDVDGGSNFVVTRVDT